MRSWPLAEVKASGELSEGLLRREIAAVGRAEAGINSLGWGAIKTSSTEESYKLCVKEQNSRPVK